MAITKMFRDRVVSMEQTWDLGEKYLSLLSELVHEALPRFRTVGNDFDHDRDFYFLLEQASEPDEEKKVCFTRMLLADRDCIPLIADEPHAPVRERIVAAIDNVRSVHNELQVLGRPSLATSAADTAITARVKKALLDAQDLHANVIKVVPESGTVYLMGLVSRREADRAAQVTSRVAGVQRVVTVFEYITEEEARRTPAPPPQ